MQEGKSVEVTDADFEQQVLQSQIPVLVDFWAEWCGPCRMSGPVIEKMAEQYEGKLKVCKVNVDEHRDSAMKAGVTSIPMLNIYKDGQVVDQMIGVTPNFEADLKKKIDLHM